MLPQIDRDRLVAVYLRARDIGLLGPGPVEAHVAHGQGYVEIVRELAPRRLLDIGSGAGVPGLLVALSLPSAEVVLLDVMAKRCAFLRSAVDELELTQRVRVLEGRCEDLARDGANRRTFDVVTARSFGSPAVTAECAVGFLREHGHLVVSEPPEDRPRWSPRAMEQLGYGPRCDTHAGFVTFELQRAEERYPRRVGVPNKRPLF